MTGRRGLLVSLAACLLGGAVVLLAAGREWGSAVLSAATGARQHVAVTGHAVAGGLPAIGAALVVLALAAFAVRGWGRRFVGLLVVAVGVIATAVSVTSRDDVGAALARRAFAVQAPAPPVTANAWSWVAFVGGVIATVAGAAIAAFGHRWPALGRRYEAPSTRSVVVDDDATAWSALDRGEDPTL